MTTLFDLDTTCIERIMAHSDAPTVDALSLTCRWVREALVRAAAQTEVPLLELIERKMYSMAINHPDRNSTAPIAPCTCSVDVRKLYPNEHMQTCAHTLRVRRIGPAGAVFILRYTSLGCAMSDLAVDYPITSLRAMADGRVTLSERAPRVLFVASDLYHAIIDEMRSQHPYRPRSENAKPVDETRQLKLADEYLLRTLDALVVGHESVALRNALLYVFDLAWVHNLTSPTIAALMIVSTGFQRVVAMNAMVIDRMTDMIAEMHSEGDGEQLLLLAAWLRCLSAIGRLDAFLPAVIHHTLLHPSPIDAFAGRLERLVTRMLSGQRRPTEDGTSPSERRDETCASPPCPDGSMNIGSTLRRDTELNAWQLHRFIGPPPSTEELQAGAVVVSVQRWSRQRWYTHIDRPIVDHLLSIFPTALHERSSCGTVPTEASVVPTSGR